MKTVLANNITAGRKNLGLTQQQLATKLRVQQKRYATWEAGRAAPKIQMVLKLADIFGVTDLRTFIRGSDVEILANEISKPTS